MLSLEFFPTIFLRSPVYSFQSFDIHSENKLINSFIFQTGLFLASPELYRRLKSKQFDIGKLTEGEKLSLLKYLNRICFRPTPFGFFASISLIKWDEQNIQIILQDFKQEGFKILIDQVVVNELTKYLLKRRLTKSEFIINPTLYKCLKELRFIRTIWKIEDQKVNYRLEATDATGITNALLNYVSRKNRAYKDIVQFIIKHTNCKEDEAVLFVSKIIEAQMIIFEKGYSLSTDHFNRLISQSVCDGIKEAEKILYLAEKVKSVTTPDLEALEKIEKEISNFFLDENLKLSKSWFYGMYHRPVIGSLGISYQDKLFQALDCLYLLNKPKVSHGFVKFLTEFVGKFDQRKVPLMEVFDPEIGLNYDNQKASVNTEGLMGSMPNSRSDNNTSTQKWSEGHRLLFQKWTSSILPLKEIRIDENDLKLLPRPESVSLPPSLSVVFNVYNETILIEAVGSVTANSLIGRFTEIDDDFLQCCREIAEIEQKTNEGVIFAEIAYLSNMHDDNINRKASIYKYELLINSSPNENVLSIPISDLLLYFSGNELILESITLKKRVIPRLSSAYNYQINDLSLFRFLNDLQYQGLHANLTLDMESLFPELNFYPRVSYNAIILSRATWYMIESEIKYLIQDIDIHERFQYLSIKRNLPMKITLAHNDKELVFDLSINEELKMFISCIKNHRHVCIREFIDISNTVQNTNGQFMANQFVAPLINKVPIYQNTKSRSNSFNHDVIRVFPPGSKWLYFKIYCSPIITNKLLIRKIFPLIKRSDVYGIQNWFFIRYKDDKPHIRIRMLLNEDKIGLLLKALKVNLVSELNSLIISQLIIDTYIREIERYGPDFIDDVELFSGASSNLVINFLKNKVRFSAKIPDYFFAFRTAFDFINQIYPNLEHRINFITALSDMFFKEQKHLPGLKFSLDKKYREIKEDLNKILNISYDIYKHLKIGKQFMIASSTLQKLLDRCDANSERKFLLAADLIHMHLNRIFIEESRYQETIIYYCLKKYLISIMKKSLREITTKNIIDSSEISKEFDLKP